MRWSPSTIGVFVVVASATMVLTGCVSSPGESAAESPAGPHLLYEGASLGQLKVLFVADDEGQGGKEIAADVAPGVNHVHGDWSPDGKQIAFEALADEAAASVWVVDADGSNPTETVTCTAAPCLQIAQPAWSPDGLSLLVVQFDDRGESGGWGASQLVIFDIASATRRVVARTSDGASAFYDPRWSPDGNSIVAELETYPDATQSEISSMVIVTIDTRSMGESLAVPVSDPALFAGHPDWSPDGKLIVFGSYDLSAFGTTDQSSNLYTISPDGSGLRQVTSTSIAEGQRIGQPTWTPDGKRIVATLATVDGDTINTVSPAYVDPATGTITALQSEASKARLQP